MKNYDENEMMVKRSESHDHAHIPNIETGSNLLYYVLVEIDERRK